MMGTPFVLSFLLKLDTGYDELLDFWHLTCVTVISHLVVPRLELSLYSRSLSICDYVKENLISLFTYYGGTS